MIRDPNTIAGFAMKLLNLLGFFCHGIIAGTHAHEWMAQPNCDVHLRVITTFYLAMTVCQAILIYKLVKCQEGQSEHPFHM